MKEIDNCPHCNESFIGEPIPEDRVKYYPGTHWRKEIGIDGGMLGIYDGIVAYMCPACEEFFPRGDSNWALEMFDKFMEKTK